MDVIRGDDGLATSLGQLDWTVTGRKLRDWRESGPVLRVVDPGGGRGRPVLYPTDAAHHAGLILNGLRFTPKLANAVILGWMWGADPDPNYLNRVLRDAIDEAHELARAASYGQTVSSDDSTYGKRSRATEELPKIFPNAKPAARRDARKASGQVGLGKQPTKDGWKQLSGLVDVSGIVPDAVDVLGSVLSLNRNTAAQALAGLDRNALTDARNELQRVAVDRFLFYLPDDRPTPADRLAHHKNEVVAWQALAIMAPAVPALLAQLTATLEGPDPDG